MAVFVGACKKPDTTAPTLDVIEMTPSPGTGLVCGESEQNVIALNSTQTFSLTFRLSDDQELSQYKIDIHNNFDCHGHAGKVETTDWYVVDIKDVAGSDETITREFPVPVDVTTGMYHFSIQATDAAGNNAETAIYSLSVSNQSDVEAPVLAVTTPAQSSFSAQKGSTINFQGSLTDNNALGEGTNGRLELVYWNVSNQTISDLYDEEIAASIGSSYDFSFNATVPVTTVDGTYIFEVRAFDAVNNPSNAVQFTVEVN